MGRKWIVYLTWNLINQKIYVGVRHNKRINPYEFDNYLGSGKHLKRAINLYGKENFKRITMFVYDNKKEAFDKESEIVDKTFVNRKDTYNMKVGGEGAGPEHHREDSKEKIRIGNKKYWETSKGKERRIQQHENMSGENNPIFGTNRSEETKEKMRIAAIGRCHLTSEILEQRLLDIEVEPKIHGWKSKLGRTWGVDSSTAVSFIELHAPHLIDSPLFEQRLLDIKNDPKTFGGISRLSKKWNITKSGVTIFLKKYSPDTVFEPNPIIKRRKLDVINIPKVYGWKAVLSRMWDVSERTVAYFIEQYLPKYINPPLSDPRRLDVKNIPKKRGWISKLGKQWGISNSSAGKYIKKYASDLV